ncbi:hypothetical protein V8E53_003259 [Lactarius tabidus]
MLGPFVFQRRAVVTPAVAPLDYVSILDGLCAALREVAHIFDHPLEALLSPELARSERLVPIGSEDWPHEAEFYNFMDNAWICMAYCMHRFRSTASPIKRLMADILLVTARIAYARELVFQPWGPGQLKTFVDVQRVAEAAALAAAPHSHPTPSPRHIAPTTIVMA